MHHVCAIRAPEVCYHPDTNTLQNVDTAYTRSRCLVCTVCSLKGATIGCYVSECKNVYHHRCLYGSTAPSPSSPEAGGSCLRLDEYYVALCPAHVSRAGDRDLVRSMRADAGLSNSQASLSDETDAPGFKITGIRRYQTGTIYCRAWGLLSVPVEKRWAMIVTRPVWRLLRPGEAFRARERPRCNPHAALPVALRTLAFSSDGAVGAEVRDDMPVPARSSDALVCANTRDGGSGGQDVGDATASGAPRAPLGIAAGAGQGGTGRGSPVFLVRNLCGMRIQRR